MVKIEYTEDEYNILVETEFTDYTGEYRVIQYNEGYYALQKLMKAKTFLNPSLRDEYVTVLVSPLLDIDGEIVNFDVPLGKNFIEEVFENIKEADRSFNGHYWELRLFLSESGEESFTEIITKGEGETLLEQINELCLLEEEQRLYFLENYDTIMFWKILAISLFIILLSLYIYNTYIV